MVKTVRCPALFIAAPSSGVGKTSITAGLARYHRNQGKDVRCFKIGPDYLDPKVLEKASGKAVFQLDLWMMGENECRRYLYEAAEVADLILIEGAMGLFDGNPSGADLAIKFGIPVVAIIDARGMAQTFAAVAQGLSSFNTEINFAGVVATRLGSDWHTTVIQEKLSSTIPLLAAIRRDDQYVLPHRHLGLVPPDEQSDFDSQLNNIANAIEDSLLVNTLIECEFSISFMISESSSQPLNGIRIGIAQDAAFSFIYPANINCLQQMGAQIKYFSPLNDSDIPNVDSLWFPGGYPELYVKTLSDNISMKRSIVKHYNAGRKIYAECGGMMYMSDSLTDLENHTGSMLGLLPGDAAMTERTGCQGMQSLVLPEGELRGHAHHRSTLQTTVAAISYGKRTRSDAPGEAIYRVAGLTASYLHGFFPSNKKVVKQLFAS